MTPLTMPNVPWIKIQTGTKWILGIGLPVVALLWSASVLGKDMSANLTADYMTVQESQHALLQDTQEFQNALLNPKNDVPLEDTLKDLREKAINTIAALAGMRTPSDRIKDTKHAYRAALQDLIAISNRFSLGDVEGIDAPLYNAVQSVTNAAGDLTVEVRSFQNGIWPQLKAAIF